MMWQWLSNSRRRPSGIFPPMVFPRYSAARGSTPMKFTWFHLMPWPHMPDDFREKHRSVWVDLPSRMYEPELGHIAYHQYLDQLEYAEQVGFDGIGVNEHHANAYGLMPSPNIMAATLTRRTSRAALVVLGNSRSEEHTSELQS